MHHDRRRVIVAAACLGYIALLGVAAFWSDVYSALIFLPLAGVASLWLIPTTAAAATGRRSVFIAVLAVVVFLADANFRYRHWADKSFDWQVALKGGAWLYAGIIGCTHLGLVRHYLARPPVLSILVLTAFLAASAGWSGNPAYTLNSAFAYGVLLLFSVGAVCVLRDDDIILGLALGFAAIVIPSILWAPMGNSVAGPSVDVMDATERLAGITVHPTGLAIDAALAILLCALALVRGIGPRWVWGLVIAGATGCLLLSGSRMPVVAMAAAWAIAFSRARGASSPLLAAVLAVGTAAGLVITGLGFDALLSQDLLRLVSRSGDAQEITTLTGRLEIWRLVLANVAERPWFGNGFATGLAIFQGFHRWHVNQAHNVYLQTLLYTGITGLCLLLVASLTQITAILQAPHFLRDLLCLFVLFLGLTEAQPISNTPNSTTVIWMIGAALCARGALRAPVPARPTATGRSRGEPPLAKDNGCPALLSE